MNKNQRKQLDSILERIEDLKSEIESIRDEEQEKMDNMMKNICIPANSQSVE
jgi:uncharacterized protein (UPF0335 family)